MDRNPLKGLTLPREASPKRPSMTPERYERTLQVADQVDWRFRASLILARETGHRIGAIRQLRWSDIDLDRGVICWSSWGDKIRYEHETPLTEALSRRCSARGGSTPALVQLGSSLPPVTRPGRLRVIK